jgi:putative FmdB family regulatory protein
MKPEVETAVPLYEYHCGTCGSFELIRRFSDPSLEACPTCTGPIEKLLSAPAFQFKGTGWYVTDYARKGTNGDGKKDGDVKRESDSKKGSEGTKDSDSKGSGESKKEGPSPSSSSGTTETKSAGASDTSAKPATKPASTGA